MPVTLSTDPRHSFTDNPGTGMLAGPFSQWPESLGLAAIRDEATVELFGDIARREYLAVGIRVALSPQIDLATEPRWSRQLATFGEDAELTARLGVAYVRGFQGAEFGHTSVSTITKHFPGGGPQKDGEDPHFAHGREQVYPGGQFELHMRPFEALIAAGTRQMMPYYGIPIGTEHPEVAFAFNKSVITGLLRERLGFEGVVCTDWGLILPAELFGDPFPARAWGVEHLTPLERVAMVLDAGADQFGGEACPELIIELVESGRIPEERLDVSARRLLREKFALGLFDNPFVDEDAAGQIAGNPEFRAAETQPSVPRSRSLPTTRAALRCSVAAGAAPLCRGESTLRRPLPTASLVDRPEDADAAVIRLKAPYEQRSTAFENFFHSGSLDFPEDVLAHVRAVAAAVPTVVDVFADRPAILAPIVDAAAAVTVNWGASAPALLDVLTGVARPQGRLPFDLPRSMPAVEASRPDVPFDTADPLFRFGHGLVDYV
ncbi:glycoside hydrolase family 3 protein [Tessaracoccus sp.]|uniref:glycoside hydrolase family 3 protein n=1 Tax=Tessaracoccus sp. TaxID=1971211 RepID=UPI002631D2CB|nr:glycoside hydrolase family 3 N-terminal domain-containing protein [Tessaracoccus sp.]